ncbi:MAG: hypothetical protein KJ858_01830, partial [Nanoarchaeota archaeon]|nr:hypothetical protein [Nanoarchaeota archaeon]
IVNLASAGEKLRPTWYDRPENSSHVVTHQVGEINGQTQGVVTIYGADWCGPCNILEREIKESKLAEKLAKERVVFRFIRNQKDEEKGSRVNEFLKRAIRADTTEVKLVPCIFIDDLGKSQEGDERELAIGQLGGKFEGLENHIRRYALDQKVSLLTDEEVPKVLEAIGSGLFKIQYKTIWENGRTGFYFEPRDVKDPKTADALERLQTIGNAVRIYDARVNKDYKPTKIEKPKHAPTQEQFDAIRVNPSCRDYFEDEMSNLTKTK